MFVKGIEKKEKEKTRWLTMISLARPGGRIILLDAGRRLGEASCSLTPSYGPDYGVILNSLNSLNWLEDGLVLTYTTPYIDSSVLCTSRPRILSDLSSVIVQKCISSWLQTIGSGPQLY